MNNKVIANKREKKLIKLTNERVLGRGSILAKA